MSFDVCLSPKIFLSASIFFCLCVCLCHCHCPSLSVSARFSESTPLHFSFSVAVLVSPQSHWNALNAPSTPRHPTVGQQPIQFRKSSKRTAPGGPLCPFLWSPRVNAIPLHLCIVVICTSVSRSPHHHLHNTRFFTCFSPLHLELVFVVCPFSFVQETLLVTMTHPSRNDPKQSQPDAMLDSSFWQTGLLSCTAVTGPQETMSRPLWCDTCLVSCRVLPAKCPWGSCHGRCE